MSEEQNELENSNVTPENNQIQDVDRYSGLLGKEKKEPTTLKNQEEAGILDLQINEDIKKKGLFGEITAEELLEYLEDTKIGEEFQKILKSLLESNVHPNEYFKFVAESLRKLD